VPPMRNPWFRSVDWALLIAILAFVQALDLLADLPGFFRQIALLLDPLSHGGLLCHFNVPARVGFGALG